MYSTPDLEVLATELYSLIDPKNSFEINTIFVILDGDMDFYDIFFV